MFVRNIWHIFNGMRKNPSDWTNRAKAVCDTAKANVCPKQKGIKIRKYYIDNVIFPTLEILRYLI